jgi:hypothetical protein
MICQFHRHRTRDWGRTCTETASLQAKNKISLRFLSWRLWSPDLAANICLAALRLSWGWRLTNPRAYIFSRNVSKVMRSLIRTTNYRASCHNSNYFNQIITFIMNKLWSRIPCSCSCVKAFQIDSVSSWKVSGGIYSRSVSVPNFRCLVSITQYLLLSDLQRKSDLAKLSYWYFIFHTNIIPLKMANSSKIYKDTMLLSPQICNGYHFDILDRGV